MPFLVWLCPVADPFPDIESLDNLGVSFISSGILNVPHIGRYLQGKRLRRVTTRQTSERRKLNRNYTYVVGPRVEVYLGGSNKAV